MSLMDGGLIILPVIVRTDDFETLLHLEICKIKAHGI